MVTRVTLTDVVEERAQHQEVRSVHTIDQTGGVHCGLPQVPIDGVRVIGVALRFEANGLPLRQQPEPEPPLVERLDDGQRRFAAQQEVDQQLSSLVGPGIGQCGRRPRQAIERATFDARVVAGGGGRDAADGAS